jgi:hypothetical protein
MERRQIDIDWLGACTRKVNAVVIGNIAVHPLPGHQTGSYRVTHVPTGYGVTSMTFDLKTALRLAKEFSEIDSDFTDPYAMPDEFKRQAKTILRKYGCSPVDM